MKNVDQMKEILSANKRRELIPAFLSLIEMEWPSVLPFVKRQLQDSFSSEENTVSSTYFLLVGGEPAGLISDQPKRVYPAQKGFVSLHRSAFCGATLPRKRFWREASGQSPVRIGEKGIRFRLFYIGSYRLL